MTGRARRLGRLLAIRRLSEEMDRRALALALASAAEVETALGRQEASRAAAMVAVRAALQEGNRAEWLMAEAQGEVAGWNRDRLRVLLRARTEAVGPAMEKFLESRREHEQVKKVIEDARQAESVEQDRRAQVAADDWFLSQRTRSTPSETDEPEGGGVRL